MNAELHLNDFLDYISSEKGLSENTRKAYQRDITAFLAFLQQNGAALDDVTEPILSNFLEYLQGKKFAPASCGRTLIALKVFFRFLKREGVLDENPAYYLSSPKLWQMLPEVLSEEEAKALLDAPDRSSKEGARDAAILELLYSSGMRVSELCGLKLKDVEDTFIKVFGKGSKERLVPIGEPAIKALDHYLGQWRGDDEAVFLFVTQQSKPINRQNVWSLVRSYAKAAGLHKLVTPHTLRHTYATHMLNHGADLRIIQELLGHASISSTERYTHLSKKHLTEAFQRCHPRP
ncbi:MAG: site-specific tyrosine recombinase XerD [Parachlamydiaceae bacterium]